MRRIVVAIMSTISGLVLLFVYPTSHGAALATATPGGTPGSTPGTGGSGAATPAPSAGSGSPSDSAAAGSAGGASGGSSSSSSSSSSGSSGPSGLKDGTFTGDSTDTRWGPVQVQVTVSGGKVTQAEAVVYPQENPRDQQINAYALPVLSQEAVAAQSAQIDAVSGATVTSDGYITSLQSALDRAHA